MSSLGFISKFDTLVPRIVGEFHASQAGRCAAETWGMRTEALGSAKEAHCRWAEGRSEQGASKENDAPP